MKQLAALFLISVLFLSSCTVNSHVMLKTPKGYVFDTPPDKPVEEYVITPNDIIQFRLFSNDGFQIVDIAANQNGKNSALIQRNEFSYVVQNDGSVRLPVLDTVLVAGKTIQETEMLLQEQFAEFYVDPYVQVEVTNKRVIIFPGTGSNAQVIILKNNNTTLMEALAMSGGISREGKAKKIKIIRKSKTKEEIYLIDMSTIDGLKYGNMIMQGNDVIYVEPTANLAREVLADVTPVISLLSSTLFIWVSLRSLGN